MCDCSLCRQEALLAAISEKDANIALLELSSSKKKKTQEEVAALKREKDSLVQQLKQQVGLLCRQLPHTHHDIQVGTGRLFLVLKDRVRNGKEKVWKVGKKNRERSSTGEMVVMRGAKKTRVGEKNRVQM